MSDYSIAHQDSSGIDHDEYTHDGYPHPKGFWPKIMRWVTTTNHKDIATMYLWLSLAMFFVAGAMALLIRAELFQPGARLLNPDFFNQMTTLHGLIMVFGVVMPAFVGLANWQIPLMIGAPDMALPRLNNWSFWILPFAFALLVSTLFQSGSAPNFGWTFYAPLSTSYGPPSTDFMIFAIHLIAFSSILASINIIATIINMRAPGMNYMKMPVFVWSWFITAVLLLGIMPVLAGTVTMMLTDRHFGTTFFNAAGGGDPVLFRHVFWFFGHPEVYVLILPAFGVMSEVIPTFARKPLFGYSFMVWAIIAIASLSYIVWAHHMFTTNVSLAAQLYFMYAAMLIAVPTGIKVFNWVATIYRGSLTFEAPMLFAVAFVFLFTLGGFSGLMLSIVPLNYQYNDTYFVVAHLHYVLVPGSIFALMAAVYYWLPKWTGHMYNEAMAKWHFWLSVISLNITFFPMYFLGLAGMPRRVPDYALQFTDLNVIATIGAFLFGFSQLLFLINIVRTVRHGKPAANRVWEGAQGLEWELPSPPPYHSWTAPPDYIPGSSYWPIIGSIALFCIMFGAANWLHDVSYGPYVFGLGLAIMIVMLFGWFGTVIRENQSGLYDNRQVNKCFRWGMWGFVFSQAMFFSVFFGALFYIRQFSVPWLGGEGSGFMSHLLLWPDFNAGWPILHNPDPAKFAGPQSVLETWGLPALMTLILLASSVSITIAYWGLLKRSQIQALVGQGLTIILAICFLAIQAHQFGIAYREKGLTLGSGAYGTTFFTLTGFHALHAALASIMLIVIFIRMLYHHFDQHGHFGFEAVFWYWQFVNVVWLMLFVFVYWM